MHSRKMIKVFQAFVGCALVIMSASAHDGGREVGKAFVKVARNATPSVVFIHVESRSPSSNASPSGQQPEGKQPLGNDLLQQFFGDKSSDTPASPKADRPEGARMVKSQGSGFVIKAGPHAKAGKTYVLTSNHVVSGAEKIRVQLKDGREFDTGVTGRDPQSGIAVLEIDATGLPALSWGDSSKLEVGEWVLAIGNPFGLNHTLTAGIVSAKGRTSLGINDYEDFIQTDAAINPGNAGGPLVNLKGKVVGINSAIFSSGGAYTGIGFAIPSNLASTIAAQLVAQGWVARGYLGIVLQPLTPDLAKSFNVSERKGLIIVQVGKGSPADKAGMRQGDVILKFDNETAHKVSDFRNRVAFISPGRQISITLLRDGKQQMLKVKVEQLPAEKPTPNAEQ